MRRAVRLAAAHRPHPNPRVGALAVDAAGEVVGEGAHVRPGEAHAEVVALAASTGRKIHTLVVTLEPCNHHGRTPPCVEAIVGAGVSRVVIGCADPDRAVRGGGAFALRAAGVEVIEGVLADEVESADRAYFHHRRTGRAMVTLKSAITLDGQTGAADGSSRWISGESARADAHRLRGEVDAIVVGAGTVIADDPRLDVRLDGYHGPQPRPVVVVGERRLPAGAAILSREPLVYAAREMEVAGAEVMVLPAADHKVDLVAMAVDLGGRGYLDVMVEGGAGLAAALWEADLIDRGIVYIGARLAGGVGKPVFDRRFDSLMDSRPIVFDEVERVGEDLRVGWHRRDR